MLFTILWRVANEADWNWSEHEDFNRFSLFEKFPQALFCTEGWASMEGDFILKLVKSLFGFSSGVHADMIVSRIWGNDALKLPHIPLLL